MPTIRVDDDVIRELQRRAYEEQLVFGNPNQVLRLILELDLGKQQAKLDGSVIPDSARNPSTVTVGARGSRVTGKQILRTQHRDLPQTLRAYSDRDGGFYEWPKSFPAVLFDSTGYIILQSEDHLRNLSHFRLYPGTRKINAQGCGSIGSIPGYVQCSHSHERAAPSGRP